MRSKWINLCWLLLFSWGFAGCGGGSCDTPNPDYNPADPNSQSCLASGGSVNLSDEAFTASQAAAVSLTNALLFANEGAIKIPGEFPGNTSSANSEGEVTLYPGDSSSISTTSINPDDLNDPVVASLVWMEGADSFISLPAGTADSTSDDSVSNTFTVDESVCDDLCNIIHDIKCYEAAQTASGVITQATLTSVILECTGSGDPVACPGGSGGGSGGGGSSGGGTDSPAPSNPPVVDTPGTSSTGMNCDSICQAADNCCGFGPDSVAVCVAQCANTMTQSPMEYMGMTGCIENAGGLNSCAALAECFFGCD